MIVHTLLKVLFSFTLTAHATPAPVCEVTTLEGLQFRLCVFPGDRNDNQDLVYFFHGAGGDEHQWDNPQSAFSGKALYDLWASKGRKVPTVASIALFSPQVSGNYWVVSDLPAPGSTLSLREIFEKKVIPTVEAKWPLGTKGRRLLLGTSMGGYNVYALWLRSPQLYAKAAALCAGVSSLSPYATDTELTAYLKRSNQDWWFGRGPVQEDVLKLYRTIWAPFFQGSTDVWKKSNVQAVVQSKELYAKTSLHAVFNLRDSFGFGAENQSFAELLKARGLPITFETNQKGHCEGVFTPTLADFLTR